jgi:hypothetical protein
VTRVLHLLKDSANAAALEVIRSQAADPGVRLTIVLMHEAVHLSEPLPGEVYRLREGHPGLPTQALDTIGPAELLHLIFAADSIVSW